MLLLAVGARADENVVEVSQVCLPPPSASLTPAMRARIAQWLDWRDFSPTSLPSKTSAGCSANQANLCGGSYQEKTLEGFSAELPKQDDMKVSADEAMLYPDGKSTLSGDVVVIQPNREMHADTAYIIRDAKTQQVTQIDLIGQVAFREPGRVIYGDVGHYWPLTQKGDMDNALYRLMLEQPRSIYSDEKLQAWGRAASAKRDEQILYLKDATYTTCAPQDAAWRIKAKELELNKETGRGEAYHATLDFHDVPVFYFPYYNFPIDSRRESGFLVPVMGYSNNYGMNIGAPYYWNMAPNYDMVITPNYYSERGLALTDDFRFLTETSRGNIMVSGIMHDQKFQQFINDNDIEDVSDNRDEIYFKDATRFNPNWSFNTQYHSVSDDYYLQNFGSSIAETTQNQLLQQADIDFNSDHWTSTLMMQHYETLHPINQTAVGDVYSRYPQWILNGNYGALPGGLNFNINNEYDNFVWTNEEETLQPLGGRVHTNPIFSRPMMGMSGYITPTVQVQETNYNLTQNTTDLPTDMNILVPQTSVDSSLYFDRNATIGGKDWTQTLEPRMYYLYVPYVNQTQVPNFDSGYYTFTYDQLFRPNRFSGIDRVGDSNQTTLALMSRFLDPDSGTEVFHWGVGETYYFEDRQVQLMQETDSDLPYADPTSTAGYTSPTDNYSPIASQIAYYITPTWSLLGDGSWDPNTSETNNATINLHYQPGINQIINVGYSFLVNGDQVGITDLDTEDGNLNQAILSAAWPFTPNHQWSALGSWTQNISHNYPMSYSAGVQYEDCCWAVRFMGGKIYSSLDTTTNLPVYNTGIYLQFLLKGLGNIANSVPTQMLNNVTGYQDIFKS